MVLFDPLQKFIKQDRNKINFETINFPQGTNFLELQKDKINKFSKKNITYTNGYNINDSYKVQTALQLASNNPMSSNQELIENFENVGNMYVKTEDVTTLADEERKSIEDIIDRFNEKKNNYNKAQDAYTKALNRFVSNNADWPNSQMANKYGGKAIRFKGGGGRSWRGKKRDIFGYVTYGGFFKKYSNRVLNKQKELNSKVLDAQKNLKDLLDELDEKYYDINNFKKDKRSALKEYNKYAKFLEKGGDGTCFKDNKRRRDLPYVIKRFGKNKKNRTEENQEECEKIAYEKGFDYVGFRGGRTCNAGNNPGSWGLKSNCNRTGNDGSNWGGHYANTIYKVGDIPENPDSNDDIIDIIQSEIEELENVKIPAAQKIVDDLEEDRKGNECFPAQTGKNFEISLKNPRRKKYRGRRGRVGWGSGVQLNSKQLTPPMYVSTPMKITDTCTNGEFKNEEDYEFVLNKYLKQYTKDLVKAQKEYEEIQDEINGNELINIKEGFDINTVNQKNTKLDTELVNSLIELKKNMVIYQDDAAEMEYESKNFQNILGMYEDSELNAISRNQQFIFWSFLAIIIVGFTITRSR